VTNQFQVISRCDMPSIAQFVIVTCLTRS